MDTLRFDMVFSYWIFFWYILYILDITTYSPKFALIAGLIENFGLLLLMLTYGTSFVSVFYFIIINTLIKIVPLYYLRNQPLKMKDVAATVFLFMLYAIWLYINKQTLVANFRLTYVSLLYNQHKTPFMALLQQFA